MPRTILIDANLLIGAFDGDPENNPEHDASLKKVEELLQDPDVRLATSALIRYEVLRNVQKVSVDELEAILNDFQQFDIREKEARRAAEIYRHARANGQKLDKRTFDVFHYVCAELNGLEFDSQDGDIPKIRQLLNSGGQNA
jgi:predicted nucleic acid-binding protein